MIRTKTFIFTFIRTKKVFSYTTIISVMNDIMFYSGLIWAVIYNDRSLSQNTIKLANFQAKKKKHNSVFVTYYYVHSTPRSLFRHFWPPISYI